MPRMRAARVGTANAKYELVIAPVSGAAMRMPVHGAEIASLLEGNRVLFADEAGQSYVAELVQANDAADKHHGRAQAPIDDAAERDSAGSLG